MLEYVIAIVVSLASLSLFIFEKLKIRRYTKVAKNLFPVFFAYTNSNDASIIVKDENGKIIFSTTKKCIEGLEKYNHKNIESIEVNKENEIVVKGGSFELIDIIEKFCFLQNNYCQTGFVKLSSGLFYFLSKKICVDGKNYYLFIYQPEKSFSDLTEILSTLSNLRGIFYSKYGDSLLIFRSDEDFTIFKNHIKLKC